MANLRVIPKRFWGPVENEDRAEEIVNVILDDEDFKKALIDFCTDNICSSQELGYRIQSLLEATEKRIYNSKPEGLDEEKEGA